ncbi:glycosyltransferase family 2 protein [Candidatus Dependentiae bacterium]|nr:glycosyltransferase family 2 protein [Candidatus Dependentiae bacterium]
MAKKPLVLSCIAFLWCASLSSHTKILKRDEPVTTEFVILITTYNSERYCESNLASVICQQSSRPYQVIVINDCSTDRTAELLNAYVRNNRVEHLVTIIHKTKRSGCLKNIYSAIHKYIDDYKVVVSVDGDDELLCDKVLLRLEQEYKDPHIHLTHGTFLWSSSGKRDRIHSKKLSKRAIRKGTLRKQSIFQASHLKTFKAGLFKRIKKKDLMLNEKFFPMATDAAFMYPMIEMLAPTKPLEPNHIAFIPEVLYKYNSENPLNEFRVDFKQQQYFYHYISRQNPYKPIDTAVLQNPRTPDNYHSSATFTSKKNIHRSKKVDHTPTQFLHEEDAYSFKDHLVGDPVIESEFFEESEKTNDTTKDLVLTESEKIPQSVVGALLQRSDAQDSVDTMIFKNNKKEDNQKTLESFDNNTVSEKSKSLYAKTVNYLLGIINYLYKPHHKDLL